MQIVKRERVLTDSEIDELLDFADEMTDKQMKLGALILADEHKQAKKESSIGLTLMNRNTL